VGVYGSLHQTYALFLIAFLPVSFCICDHPIAVLDVQWAASLLLCYIGFVPT
jgi:hypothetical protein